MFPFCSDLTDKTIPRRLGPKRVGKIRKLYNLSKEDDVRQYIIRRPLPVKENKKPAFKAPKIQRLITPVRLQRKRRLLALKKKWGKQLCDLHGSQAFIHTPGKTEIPPPLSLHFPLFQNVRFCSCTCVQSCTNKIKAEHIDLLPPPGVKSCMKWCRVITVFSSQV